MHLAAMHDLYSCPRCQKRIKGGNAYKEHVNSMHQRRACLYCISTFKDEDAYQSHKEGVHLASKRYRWFCNNRCGERFPTFERFIIHVFVYHKKYACPHCMQTEFGKENDKKPTHNMSVFETEIKYLTHVLEEHKRWVCLQCNMQAFKTQKDYNNHCFDCNVCCEAKTIKKWCEHCKRLNKFRNKAEHELHELQHAFLLYFLEQTICERECCTRYLRRIADTYAEVKRLTKGKKDDAYAQKVNSVIQAVRAFAMHVLEIHKRCLFCEHPLEKESSLKELKNNLCKMTYRDIAEDARTFLQLDENILSGEIPVIPCNMCGLPLTPNRKSQLFYASIRRFPLGKGLDVRNYPFYHLEYDERKAEKNTMMSVIKEVPANEEESCLILKKAEKENTDDIILGKEDEAEDEESEKEEEEGKEEEKKEKRKEFEPKNGK